LPDVPVIVGRRRYLSGKFAIERFQPDVILLDDGFQHIQLDRTCDLVLIDATNPFGGGYMLPAGFLREPVENLARAHAFVITRSDEVADISPICQRLRQINSEASVFKGIHTHNEIRRADTGEPLMLEKLKDRRILGISGLANPISFHRLLNSLGLTIVKYFDFPDHHWYTKQDAHRICRILAEDQIDAIMTTEKDEVKLSLHFELLEVPVYVITIKMDVQPEKEFEELLLSLMS
jgi:tetraacyldisaccharide 4'-kinase